ncbi:Beta-ketoacyl synthase [Cordyceps fumosorosea ARSEF 2679]|uniref:Beta-ketoacyl synthase n=1 Tax=Cordyceps fumosorosea (strain ARSEF 2679) TaxID=1081104 RepID=A0A167Q604_CORFA|nr:Beta-ketoacyl synthase [Cordyceps fumosorosea ARSEF 2679]OAA57329.1 Beta-ketoacyl synthase [Cordyceps fumosorosea ARSEF 2679]
MVELNSTTAMQDPSVIVGAACRVPGATNLHELWDLLDAKRDVQRKIPSERYNADAFYHPEGANKGTPIDQFDAAFFNISGKEAEAMDPQQRLLLEVVYEALENAGITLKEIRGTRTAVFAGSFTYDYQSMTNRDLANYPKYTVTGTDANAILANRISYVFDLHGPSVQVDTACSSSLTAFHLAVQSLQTGESDMAIVCGTALHFDPTIFITMAEFGMLSTDGRCRHLDASGSGYVRGDGVCAVVLKRLRAAEANGDRIRAVIRGTGTNHDGIKEGMTLPNGKAQASLVRGVYARAGLDPRDTGYFEAHGTGTQAGDPREAGSIGEVFAAGREEPLYVGSIKTNIGHLEGASGLAGVMKAMLSVERGKILPNMHFDTPNPKIDFDALKIRVPTKTIEWKPENGIRRASINSFGFGGANAHVVLENYTNVKVLLEEASIHPAPKRPFLLPLSSHSENGGKLLQRRLAEYITKNPDSPVQDLVHTYSTRRSLHRFRSFAVGSDLCTMSAAATTPSPLATWKQAGESPRLGFVFTGQGAQWFAMGRQLIEESPFFANMLAECEAVLGTLPDAPSWSIVDEMTKPEGDSRLSQSEFSQPLCTALQIVLADTLRNWGVEPAAVVGHSSGEIAAAYSAGILSRRDAIICAYYRGLYMSKGRHGTVGAMMAVGLTEAEAAAELAPFAGRAGIAAINSPSSITLSGDKDAILEIKERLDERKVFARLLQVEQAFHSHHMLPLAPGFERALESTPGFAPKPAKIRMFSSVTGRDSTARAMDGTYWSDNMTGRVRFSDAVTGMVLGEDDQLAVDVLVEIGPHPALKGPTKQTVKSLGIEADIPYIGSLDRKVPAYESLLACAGQLFSLGYPVDLVAVNSEHVRGEDDSIKMQALGRLLEDTPTYSWDHKSFWSETRWNREYRQRPYRHSILGAPVPGTPSNNPRWRNYIRLSELPWLRDHSIDGSVLFPAAAYFSLGIEALVRTISVDMPFDIVLSGVHIEAALALPDTETGVEIMVDLLEFYSFSESGVTLQNCSGRIAAVPPKSGSPGRESAATFEDTQLRMSSHAPAEKFYNRLQSLGLQYGDAFKLVCGAFESGQGTAVAQLDFDPLGVRTGGAELDGCVLHPTFLDSSFHVILAALESKSGRCLADAHVATSCQSLRVFSSMLPRCKDTAVRKYWVNADTDITNRRVSSSTLRICDMGSAEPLVELHDVKFTALGLADVQDQTADAFFRMTWKPAFNLLGSNEMEPEFSGVDELLACYSHQYPGNTILRLDEGAEVAEISGSYDLLVIGKGSQQKAGALAKPESFYVMVGSQPPATELELKWKQGELSIWQAPASAPAPSEVTILLSSRPSESSLKLAKSIEASLNGVKFSTTTLDNLGDDVNPESYILSLVELDANFNVIRPASENWDRLLWFLSRASVNLVWLQKRDILGNSILRNVSRVARAENPDLQLTLLAVPGDYATKHVQDSIKHAFSISFDGEELEIQDGCLLLPRIGADNELNARYSGSASFGSFAGQDVRLSPDVFSSSSLSPPFEANDGIRNLSISQDEVEVEVETSMLLSRADAITSCVGTVTQDGSCSGLQAGRKVLVFEENQGAHASRLRVKAQLAFALDVKSLSRALPVASLLLQTAYAIHELARVQKGDKCLIYDAATPAGKMAIALLLSIGCQFVAVVGKESDRKHLLEQFELTGGSVVVGSGPDTYDSVSSLSQGKGWQIVLNCSDNGKPSSGLISSDCSHVVNLGNAARGPGLVLTYRLLSRDASRLRDLFSHAWKTLETGGHTFNSPVELLKLPYSQAAEGMQALRAKAELQQVRLYADDSPIKVASFPNTKSKLFDATKTYLLSGSFGDAGWTLAQWLFRKGARKLSVLSQAPCIPLPQQAITWLTQRGVDVTVHSINCHEELSIKEWLQSVDGRIGGVLQGSLSAKPLPLGQVNSKVLRATVQPFFDALQIIHRETTSHALEFFLCITSNAPIVGISSEAVFSVANGYLNDFVSWRRQQGFPAASLNIGLVDNVSILSETQSIKEALEKVGAGVLSEDQLFFQLEQGLLAQYPDGEADGTCDHNIISGVDFSSRDEFWSSKPICRRLFESSSSSSEPPDASKDLRSLIREATTSQDKEGELAGAFVDKIAASLSISAPDINIGLPLSSYGMDSLAAVDFRKWFSQELGVNLALFEILGSRTIRSIVQRVCQVFATQEEDKTKNTRPVEKNVKVNKAATESTVELVLPSSRPKNIPLSSFQTRQWFMDTVMERPGDLTCGWTLSIQGEPDLAAVNAAFHEVARRNEIFRTRYFEGDDMVEQEVIASVSANVDYVDLSTAAIFQGADDKTVQDQVFDLIGQPMDLEKGEVYKSRLVKLGDQRYAWIFATHHITVDGASRQSFMEQIVACYDDVRTGSDFRKSAPKLSYVDFTLWHEGYLKSDQVQVDLAWWKSRLVDAPRASKLLPFAQHGARAEKASHERRVIRSSINMAILKRMKRICSSVNVTPFHFILASLRAFIFRYTAEEDFTLLVINGERPHPAFEGIIGFFVNIIPLLWKGSFDDSFESLLAEAKALTMESMAHSQAPFDAIVDALDLGHNPAHFPLGQIALNYQMYAKSPTYTSVDFKVQDVHVTDVPTACELQLEVLEDPKTGLGFTLDYDSYLYGAADMDRFLENFITFIGNAVRDFRQPVEEIEMCGPKEMQFLRDVCWTEEESSAEWMGHSLVDRWADRVRQQPLSTAIKTSEGQSVTFSGLDKRARDVAHLLQISGVKSGDRVGVLSHPSVDVMASMLGIAMLRCVYVPLDPTAAQGRLEYMISNTSAPLVLHGPELDLLVEKLQPSTRAKFVAMTDAAPSDGLATAAIATQHPDDVCYIVFTSGSTGKPKGVMVTFENTEAMLCGRQQIHGLGANDTFLQQSSTSFDISMAQTWGSLTSGATMALATKEARQDVDELAGFIRDAGATMVYMTPTQLAMVLENCTDILKQSRKLRAVSLIGEHLPPRLVSAVYDLGLPSLTVFNEYGPSESTSQNTLFKVPYPQPGQATVDIGRPIPNSSTYVLNSRGRPVPVGVSGELCVGGPQVSLGYLGRSSDAFLDNSFVSGAFKNKGWDRLYRTGDMARFRSNGNIDLQGRISGDKQVKLRGHRIDLEEIEAEIRRVAAEDSTMSVVTGAILLARTLAEAPAAGMTDDRQLVAFLTTRSELGRAESQKIATRLHVELSNTLNKYMIPACYQLLAAFPMTVSGKIDRVGLSNMTLDPVFHVEAASLQAEQQQEVAKLQASGPVETIKSLFSSILKLPSQKVVLDTDNFFELGGQSVLALRLQKALKKELGVKVKLVDIFRSPTPSGLVQKLGLEPSVGCPVAATQPRVELDFDAEIALPNDARYLPNPALGEKHQPNGHAQRGILILGADGYIGYYMLKFLLAIHRDAKVYLVGLGDRFNLGDLFSAFTEHEMFDDRVSQTDLLTRAEIVQGTMGKAKFGLADDEFAKLGRIVDAIYHTGGFVSLLATYQELRARNVDSVRDMIELASHGRSTALHYISTWSVVHMQTWRGTTTTTPSQDDSEVWLDERSVASFRPPATNDHGYFKTRWVAEMLLEEAGRRGFLATVYRCPAHTAPTAGRCATPADNFTVNMCVRMAETGLVLQTPKRADGLESDMGMVPIDYLTDTLVRLADVAAPGDVTLRLHITNPSPLPYSRVPELVGWLHGGAVEGRMLEPDAWFEAITAVSDESVNLELAMYKEYLDKGHVMFAIEDGRTRKLLDGISEQPGRVRCDAVDLGYLKSLLRQEQGRRRL